MLALAEQLRSSLAARLEEGFIKSGRNSGRVNKKQIVDRTAGDQGREKSQPKLLWLDCVKYEAGSAGKHYVEFQLCSKAVGGERGAGSGYRATLVEQTGAPEGMAIVELMGVDH